MTEVISDASSDARVEIQSGMEQASNYNRWIVDQAAPRLGRRILDAGCGSGNLSALLLDRELVVGVDHWEDFVEILGPRFGERRHFRVHQFDLMDPAMVSTLPPYALDSAISSNVLEHVEDDRKALRHVAESLLPGSPIFLLVPAFMCIFGAHDRADHHLRRYTKRSLREMVAPLPVTIERQHYMNFPGFFAWYMLGRVLKKPLGEGEIGLYDKIIPAIRRLEGRVKPPIGQSLVALLRTHR